MKLYAQVGAVEREIDVEPLDAEGGQDGRWRVVLDGVERTAFARRIAPGTLVVHLGDEVTVVDVDPGKAGELLVEVHGVAVAVKLADPRKRLLDKLRLARPASTGPTAMTSPMPGKVVKILVKPGDAVAAGQGLIVVEAMKMENELRAPRAGTVEAVRVKEGQAVEGQELLLTIA